MNLPKKIDELLIPGEQVTNSFPNHPGLRKKDFIIITNRRLLVYRGGLVSHDCNALEFSKISSVNFKAKMLNYSKVMITEGTTTFTVER